MRRLSSRIAFATLLLLGQGLVVLHAAEFGSDAHHHDGVPCSALLHEDSDTPFLARSGTWPAVSIRQVNCAPAAVQGEFVYAPNLRPPATGPPSI